MRVDLRRADAVARFLALHVIRDAARLGTALDLDLLREGGDRCGIGRVDLRLQALPRHDAVERPRIDMQKTEPLPDDPRHAALPRSARTVNRNHLRHHLNPS